FGLFADSRSLLGKSRQAVVGVMPAISLAGPAAGVASSIIALAIDSGFRADLQQRLLGSSSHLNLLRTASDGIKNWEELLPRLEKQPHVVAGAPAIYEQVLISRGSRASGAVLKGVLPAYERKVSDLLSSVKFGSADKLNESPPSGQTTTTDESQSSLEGAHERVAEMPPIILGKDMADELGATIGSVVLVTSPQGELTPFGMVPKYVRFVVVGIFQ